MSLSFTGERERFTNYEPEVSFRCFFVQNSILEL
jgi:hypothetical protein